MKPQLQDSPEPCTIFYVRHGETLSHAEHRYVGSTDVGLTELGIQQGHELAKWAKTANLDKIFTSDLSRATITAHPSVEATGITPVVDPRLREVQFGDGEDMTRAEMREVFPAAVDSWLAAPADRSLPQGESGQSAIKRGLEALEEIVAANPGQRVLIVAHSTLGRLLCCTLLGIDPNLYREVFLRMDNAAINEFHMTPKTGGTGIAASLLSFNVPAESHHN